MLTPDMRLGQRYRLVSRIAVGGMGEVWKAQDTVLEREVAVKALLPSLLSEPGFAKRFAVEAKTVAALSHPNVVNVHDYGEAQLPNGDTTAYLVMEYVDGIALHDMISERGRIDPAVMMPIIASVADALQHAHDNGVIHRDIKPGNILIRSGDGRAVLTDFGIARSGSSGDLTQTGAVMGTASYIAPEQAEGTGVIPASDMYSLGVVAFHGLTGKRPFDAENPIELALKHVRTPAPPLPDDVPPGVRAFVERAMSKDPSHRFNTGADMAAAARASLTARPPTSVMPNVTQVPQGAGVVGMGGPTAAVAEPQYSPQGPQSQINLGAVPPAPQGGGGVNKTLLMTIVGIVALLVVGGMVWLVLQNAGEDSGGGPSGDDPSTSEATEEATEDATEPSPEPSESQGADDRESPGHGCIDPGQCRR